MPPKNLGLNMHQLPLILQVSPEAPVMVTLQHWPGPEFHACKPDFIAIYVILALFAVLRKACKPDFCRYFCHSGPLCCILEGLQQD